ncbi:MAG TPA: PadR family transcriptional regulator [Streptosporangiaceae bacterium]|nr:PadR family transcriptional regulator [Streptosporangiaceae bacterium]
MSPVFRHGGLRLYLLKLLDEAPRHGYDVIRLLQDRFLGVYSPSPGTIYPRLARLEEEGLVTHEVIDGKKVYKITEAGRAELNGRRDDLADLEDELSASVRDIARELTRDVRETVRSLRDEFTWAVREAGRAGYDPRRGRPADGEHPADRAQAAAEEAQVRTEAAQAEADAAPVKADAAQARADEAGAATDESLAGHDANAWADAAAAQAEGAAAEAEGAGAEAEGAGAGGEGTRGDAEGSASVWSKAAGEGDDKAASDQAGGQDAGAEGAGAWKAGQQAGPRRWPSGGWREWAEWAEKRDWREWADWAEQPDWREWAGKQEWKDWAKAGKQEWKERAKAGKQEWAASGRARRAADRELIVDLERLAAAFAREIRGVAWQAEALSEDAVGNLGRILTDALNRIRNEVFRPPGSGEKES